MCDEHPGWEPLFCSIYDMSMQTVNLSERRMGRVFTDEWMYYIIL